MKDVSQMRKHTKKAIEKVDDDIVERVFQIITEDENAFEDPLENLTPEQEAEFLLSLEQADKGETIPHEEVRKRYKKCITNNLLRR